MSDFQSRMKHIGILADRATDLPWKTNIKDEILSKSGRPIVHTIYDAEDSLPRQTDAEFIVEACNNVKEIIDTASAFSKQVNELEERIKWLSHRLSMFCEYAGKNGNCKLFYQCPAWKYGWTCGKVSPEEWNAAAEDFIFWKNSQKHESIQ